MSRANDKVISGLEGVLACESSVAFIDGIIPELSYRGYIIHDIAETLTYEQVVFLLWQGELPSAAELQAFSADLAARRVRYIGDARNRIREDFLRILRFFRVHAEYGAGESGALTATIDLARAAKHRAGMGFFRDRRPQLYGRICEDI